LGCEVLGPFEVIGFDGVAVECFGPVLEVGCSFDYEVAYSQSCFNLEIDICEHWSNIKSRSIYALKLEKGQYRKKSVFNKGQIERKECNYSFSGICSVNFVVAGYQFPLFLAWSQDACFHNTYALALSILYMLCPSNDYHRKTNAP